LYLCKIPKTYYCESLLKEKMKSLAEMCALVVAWNLSEEQANMIPLEVQEMIQKYMKNWRQKKYFREYKEWYSNGQLSWYETYNQEGIKEGECKQWYKSGIPKLHCRYKNGLLHGEYKEWYENGVLANQRFYKKGQLHGEAMSWSEKGVLKSHGYYREGKRHGEYRAWRKNCQLMSLSYFKEGERHGVCKHWWGNGRLYLLLNFKDGYRHGDF
jgi:antitoxin component YwqK of YwqJK toxin-antitoxin module